MLEDSIKKFADNACLGTRQDEDPGYSFLTYKENAKGSKMAGKKQLVNLEVTDKELEDIMLKHYPGKIFEEQHHVSVSDFYGKVYHFFNLEKDCLLDFLEGYKHLFEYKICDSKTGKAIMTNKVNKSKAGLIKFLQAMTSGN